MEAFKAWLAQLNLGSVNDTVIIVIASLLCITVHELCHGITAYKLGDPTAKNAGRLTLNPVKHIDPWGLVMMALFRFGWAKPVPVDMRHFKNPKRDMAITSLAGPLSNILLAYAALLLYSAIYPFSDNSVVQWFLNLLRYVASLSVGLAVFNIIPISPLDGSKILISILPDKEYYYILRYERYGFLLLMMVLFTHVLDKPLYFACTAILTQLYKISLFPYHIVTSLIS